MMVTMTNGMLNRRTTNCKWGIWGYSLHDMCLHSMTLDPGDAATPGDFFTLGIDT